MENPPALAGVLPPADADPPDQLGRGGFSRVDAGVDLEEVVVEGDRFPDRLFISRPVSPGPAGIPFEVPLQFLAVFGEQDDLDVVFNLDAIGDYCLDVFRPEKSGLFQV